MKLRIILADDHDLFRHALSMTLQNVPDIDIVAEVTNGQEVLLAVERYKPDVVCMDINMPKLNGIEATQKLHLSNPEVKIIGLSSHTDPYLVARLIGAGAHAYVDKVSAGRELLEAIRQIYLNQIFISPELGIDNTSELAQLLEQDRFAKEASHKSA
jgi:DNA-binding NarL/FixJ family response regulator